MCACVHVWTCIHSAAIPGMNSSPSSFLTIFLCMCVWHMYMSVCMCEHVCQGVGSMLGIVLNLFPCCVLRQGRSLNLELTDWTGWQANELQRPSCLLPQPQPWNTDCAWPIPLWVLRLRISLTKQLFTPWPSLQALFHLYKEPFTVLLQLGGLCWSP